MRIKANKKLKDRFFDKVKKTNSCWVWTGSICHGYGRIGFNGKNHLAHRISWLINGGNIPKNLWVLHKCNNRPCVKPGHLYVGNRIDNVNDAIKAGNFFGLINRNKKTCPYGHPYTGKNLIVRKKENGRRCRSCANKASLDYYYRRIKP